MHASLFVACGCMYLGTGIANSPCSWCAGNMSPPRLPPVDRRHLLPGHLLRGCRCGRAALCAHGHGGQVRACRVVRARTRHACEAFASPAADAPSRARRLSHVDARSSGEGAARPPLCADEAGESWSGLGHRGCTRRCLSRAGVCTSVLGSLTRPAAGARCWWRFRVQACRQTAVNAAIGSLPRRARFAKQDSSVQRNTHWARETNAHHVFSGQRFDARPSKILATRRSYNLCALQ